MKSEIDKRFTYYPPKSQEERDAYVTIRAAAKAVAEVVDKIQPDSREKSEAMTHLESFVMWANAGVARNGVSIGS